MNDNEPDKKEWEQSVCHTLAEGEMERIDPGEAAVDRLIPKYEIRIKAEKDPIAEETRIIRNMAEEIDGRYDEYMKS